MSSDAFQQANESESHAVTELFVYSFHQAGKQLVLKIPVQIPLDATIKELGYRIINCHPVACYNEEGEAFLSQLISCSAPEKFQSL